MEDIINKTTYENEVAKEQPSLEQTHVTEVKNDIGVSDSNSGSLGKFKDTESLLEAYNNLQAEFTRKCQKLSELENSEQKNYSLLNNEEFLTDFINKNTNVKNTILQGYLEEIQKNKSPQVITSLIGSGIALDIPPTPKNLQEARDIVSKLFN